MKKDKLDTEWLLDDVEIPSLSKTGKHHHVVNIELVYPRLSVARKTAAKTIPLVKGLCATGLWPWTQKICFKESVEGTFGVIVTVSEALSVTQMRKIMRYVAGKTLSIGADALEDAIPVPVVDELAKLPLLYTSKQLLASVEAKNIVEGCLDVSTDMLAEASTTLTVPLVSRRKITLQKSTVLHELDPDGSITFKVNLL